MISYAIRQIAGDFLKLVHLKMYYLLLQEDCIISLSNKGVNFIKTTPGQDAVQRDSARILKSSFRSASRFKQHNPERCVFACIQKAT